VHVIVTQKRKPYHREIDFTRLGLAPRKSDIVVVKIGYLEPELYAMRADWIMALTPDWVSNLFGWWFIMGCFLSGSDTASNLLFGNLQVAAAHQLGLNPFLLAATNSSGGAIGKMISPQNIAVGVTTVGLIGQEGRILRATFWHSILLAGLIGALACAQAYWVPWMAPELTP
jgi:hypothetical protein